MFLLKINITFLSNRIVTVATRGPGRTITLCRAVTVRRVLEATVVQAGFVLERHFRAYRAKSVTMTRAA